MRIKKLSQPTDASKFILIFFPFRSLAWNCRISSIHCFYYKRLDNGRFQWPRDSSEVRNLTRQEYRWLLEGLSIDQPKAIRPAGRKDFWPLCKREKIFLTLIGQGKHCQWLIHMTMELPGYREDNCPHFPWMTVCMWKTQHFSSVISCQSCMFSTFLFRQNDGDRTAGNSLFRRISGIIGNSE